MTKHKSAVSALVFVIVAMVFGAPMAFAEEESPYEQAYQECMSRHYDANVYQDVRQRLIDEGKISADDFPEDAISSGIISSTRNDQALKEQFPAEYQEAIEAHKEDREDLSWTAFRDRINYGSEKLDCNLNKPIDGLVKQGQEKLDGFWGDPWGRFVQAVQEGNAEAAEMVMTLWMDYKIDPTQLDSNIQGVQYVIYTVSGFALVASIIVGGGRLAASRRQGLVDGVDDMGKVIGLYVVSSLLIAPLAAGAVIASDALADWIMDSFGASSTDVFQIATLDGEDFGPVFTFIFVVIAFAGSVMQIVALAIRTLLLPIVVGFMPLMAALSFSQIGKSGFHHLLSWMIAAVAFKPISAVLYCVMFWWTTNADDSVISTLVTAVMIGAAGLTGPALVRAIFPAVSQAGGAGGAPILAGGASMAGGFLGAAGGLMARGGVKATGASGGSAGGSGGGSGGSGGGGGGSPLSGGGAAMSAGRPISSGGSASGGASQAAQPAGAVGAGGGGGRSSGGQAAQPSGAQGSAGRSQGARPSGAQGSAARSASPRRGSRGGAAQPSGARLGSGSRRQAVGSSLRDLGRSVRASGQSAYRAQGVLDESIGSAGGYHGQLPR